MITAEAPIALKGFVDIVPEQSDLGGTRELAIKPGEILKLPIYKAGVQERGSERYRAKRARRGIRSRRSENCGHSEHRFLRRSCPTRLPRLRNATLHYFPY